ncbi:MAG: bifunctional DNA-formamidopyrimidine glycosylase/DNA-(apurinic or apyrimidinic site) lyase [candidate division Zixibacteria bacterium]|nr:bifunctional DNA-formamidopyrimidine glycosylase/DNA-(apurinic or apyrimidinic site) lyase [candidate division Zixibacteria bacterium]
MPELPEVETVVRALRRTVLGARLIGVNYASHRVSRPNPRGWKDQVAGRHIAAIERRGKYILFGLSGGHHLVMHLRMTGRLRLGSAPCVRGKYDRLILVLDGPESRQVRHLVLVDTRQFARADWCLPGALEQHSGLARLGPDALMATVEHLLRIMAGTHRPIKALLLDQHALAGLGNIYADEALFGARIHPTAPADSLRNARRQRLLGAIHAVLAAAVAACGTTFDTFSDLEGRSGGFAAQLKVYGRTGEPCLRCATPVARIVIIGRSSHFCPRCQRC